MRWHQELQIMHEHQLNQRLDALQREIAPGRDLWPEIEQQINAEQLTAQPPVARINGRRMGWLSLAAGLLVLIGVGRVFLPGQIDQQNEALANMLSANAVLELQALDQSLVNPQSTPEILITSLPQGGWRVVPTSRSPAAIRIWQPALMAGLQENQQAIVTLRAAIQQQPQRTRLLRKLANAERRQHRLLRQWIDFNAFSIAGIIPASTTIISGDQHV